MTLKKDPPSSVVRLYRAKAGLTQAELAQRVGRSSMTISAIECGRRAVTDIVAMKLYRILKISSGDLIHQTL
jgi:transcriptional regulator with XRE-family HTH domain